MASDLDHFVADSLDSIISGVARACEKHGDHVVNPQVPDGYPEVVVTGSGAELRRVEFNLTLTADGLVGTDDDKSNDLVRFSVPVAFPR